MVEIFQFFLNVLVVCLARANAQISFELLDSEFNEVIFVGERDVVLRCHVIGLSSLSIVIERGDNVVVGAQLNENCFDYIIKEVSLNDGSVYRCRVVHFDIGGNMKTDTQSLHLNVQDGMPQCFRNGTEGQPYRDGEHLLMSCYCWKTEDCRWVSEVVGSDNLIFMTNYEDTLYRNKTIRRIVVDYSFSTDSNVKYSCYFIADAVQQCSIGPEIVSSNDIIISFSSSTKRTINGTSNPPPTCYATPTSIYSTVIGSSDHLVATPSLSPYPSGLSFIVIIIILTGATILLLVALLILFRERQLLKKKAQTLQKGETSECVYDRAIFSGKSEKSGADSGVSHIYFESTLKDVEMKQNEHVYQSADELQHH